MVKAPRRGKSIYRQTVDFFNQAFAKLFAPKTTRAQSSILKMPREETRLVTKAERLAYPEKFSEKGSYRVPKSVTKITKRTAFVTNTKYKDAQAGVSHGTAAKLRKQGELPYSSAAAEEQASKTRATAERKRRIKKVNDLTKVRKPSNARRRASEYRLSAKAKSNYETLRERKLAGEHLDDPDWFSMIDIANAINDPMLSSLVKS